jgi:hypothetical protein
LDISSSDVKSMVPPLRFWSSGHHCSYTEEEGILCEEAPMSKITLLLVGYLLLAFASEILKRLFSR